MIVLPDRAKTDRWAVFDIDGTLMDNRHREHLRATGDWDQYHRLTELDTPLGPMVAVADSLSRAGWGIVFTTGRPESARGATTQQLIENIPSCTVFYRPSLFRETNFPSPNNILMRPDGDRSANHRLKRRMLAEIRRVGVEPTLAFEDNPEAVRMWTEEGLTCLAPSLP